MNKLLMALAMLIKHIVKNVSNYSLFLGIIFILYFIGNKYGGQTLILSVGVLLVAISIVIEVNKPKKQKKYY